VGDVIPFLGPVGWFVVNRIGIKGGLIVAGALAVAFMWWRWDAAADARDRARAEAAMLRAHVEEQAAALQSYAQAVEAAEARAVAAEARVADARRRARDAAASGAPTAPDDAAEVAAELLRSLGARP
jgi:hypothetical protein